MVILAAPVTDIRWIGSVIGLDLVGEVKLHVPAGRVGTTFVSIILFQIIDIICAILDGLVVVVRGLVCQLAKEVSRLWFHLVVVWGGSDIVGMFGIGWLNVGFGVSPSHMEHFPLLFQLVDRFDLFRWFARSSASSGTHGRSRRR